MIALVISKIRKFRVLSTLSATQVNDGSYYIFVETHLYPSVEIGVGINFFSKMRSSKNSFTHLLPYGKICNISVFKCQVQNYFFMKSGILNFYAMLPCSSFYCAFYDDAFCLQPIFSY